MSQAQAASRADIAPSETIAVLPQPVAAAVETKDETTAPKAKGKGPAKKVARLILLVIVLLLGWYVMTDRMAPYSASGSVTAFTTQVAPRVAGEVVEVLVADNQQVAAGDVLFRLDPRPFELAVRQAEANLAQVKLTADASITALSSSQAKVEQATAGLENTKAAADRVRQLFDTGAVSQSQLDKVAAELASAEASLRAAQADLESAQLRAGSSIAANPQVETAQVQLEQARLNLEFANVLAPDDGVITNLRLAAGQFVNAGSPAMTFIKSGQPWIMLDLRENQLTNVEVGDVVSVLFDGDPGNIHEGRVQGIAWGIDPGRTTANGLPQNASSARWFEPARTIPVHIELVGGSEAWPKNARVGSKASAVIYAAGQDNPIAWIASSMQHVQSIFSFLY